MSQNATAEARSTKVKTGKVRFSYVNVFQPRAINAGQEPKYSVCILINKSDKTTLNKIHAAMEAARLNSANIFGGKIPPQLKNSLHDGDGEKPNSGEYGPECAGCFVLNASSKMKPGIVDSKLNYITDSTEFYSGCYGLVTLNFYAYNQAGNRGIGCGLNNIQKLADGDPLGGRTNPEDDFDEYNEYDDDGAPWVDPMS